MFFGSTAIFGGTFEIVSKKIQFKASLLAIEIPQRNHGWLLHHTLIMWWFDIIAQLPWHWTKVRGNVEHHSSFPSSTKTWSPASTFHFPHLWHTRPNVSVVAATTMFNPQWPKTANQRDDETDRWSKMWPLTPHSRTHWGDLYFLYYSLSLVKRHGSAPKSCSQLWTYFSHKTLSRSLHLPKAPVCARNPPESKSLLVSQS